MPFDRNSFLAGVWTGIRLQRIPGGRQPPVPSDLFILTESGEYVLMEQIGTEISFAEGDTLPITEINYRRYSYWVVDAADVPAPIYALTPGTYEVTETGKIIEFYLDGPNWCLHLEGKTAVLWSTSYTDPDLPHLYFFHCPSAEGREYALLLYIPGATTTSQLPMYFSAADFENFFFSSESDHYRMRTE